MPNDLTALLTDYIEDGPRAVDAAICLANLDGATRAELRSRLVELRESGRIGPDRSASPTALKRAIDRVLHHLRRTQTPQA